VFVNIRRRYCWTLITYHPAFHSSSTNHVF